MFLNTNSGPFVQIGCIRLLDSSCLDSFFLEVFGELSPCFKKSRFWKTMLKKLKIIIENYYAAVVKF